MRLREQARVISADEWGEADTYYWGPAVRKGARTPGMLHMFSYFQVVSLFVYCRN